MEHPRQEQDGARALGQGAALVAAQGAGAQTTRQLAAPHEGSHANKRLYRTFLLNEELRLLYHRHDTTTAEAHPKARLAWASPSQLRPFIKLTRTIRRYREGILATVRLGLSNSRMEALNSKVGLLSHGSFGFHSPKPLSPHLPLLHRTHAPPPAAMTSTPTTGAPQLSGHQWERRELGFLFVTRSDNQSGCRHPIRR